MENKKIILIEDDFDTQYLFSECLRTETYDVIPVSHGSKALEHIEGNGLPDLILMDLNTPFISTEEFVSKLRTHPGGEDTPLILVSGKADIEEYAEKLKASSFIQKPFDLDPLLNLISKTLQ